MFLHVTFSGWPKTWNLRNFENNLEKLGILYKSHGKTWKISKNLFATLLFVFLYIFVIFVFVVLMKK